MDKLSSSPRLNKLLYNMDIFTPYDVLKHLPRRYDDYSLTTDIKLEDKQRVVIYGEIVSNIINKASKRVTVTQFDVLDKSKRYYQIIAFNRPYISSTLKIHDFVTIIGTYDKSRNKINVINYMKGSVNENRTLKPMYSLPSGFQNYEFARLVARSLKELENKIFPLVPLEYRIKYKLVDKYNAFYKAHLPSNKEDIRQALRYLKYEEALMFSLKNQIIKEENKSLAKIKKEPIDLSSTEEFLKNIPFELTEDQKNAASEIIEDMNQSALMYRLLQGDVGTGKTLVSFIALYANFVRGDQGALMAPTDSLARQHYENALKLFEGLDLKIALLVGSTPKNEKETIYRDLEEGYIDLVIGTHALFSKRVKYSSLGLVIIDEQHRFGVNQRIALANKGEHADLLMMSATPIPRSLALSLYGDLDISTLYKFPNRKRLVTTSIVKSDDEMIFKTVDESLNNNRQIYVVTPLINFKEGNKFSVEQIYARFVLKYGKRVGLLHGKMKNDEKEEALRKFYANETPILVSTTVIEVGIDVKNSNTMIIYDASSFGLASLHQLRGRIGRDGSPAKCLLAVDEKDKETLDKLSILVKSEDGFEIAESDMKNRGPGELTGIKQSGMPDFHYLNMIDDYKIFVVAREDAKAILKDRNNQHYRYIIERAKKDIIYDPIING